MMFLSSRWGKPSSYIESLPMSEFHKQKLFWEQNSWGGIDDIMAMHHRTYMMTESGGKVKTTVTDIKKIAMYAGAVKIVVVESTKTIRAAFMSIYNATKGKR